MFSKLLIPVDGSAPATQAARIGLELATKYDADVDILHAVKRGRLSGSDPNRAEEGRELLQEATDFDVDGDPSVDTHLVDGRPHEVIGAHVEDNDVDLVVMGRRGQTGVKARLLGSTAERVLRQVDVPIVTVSGDSDRPETGRSYEDVLLTTDGSDVAERGGPYAADLARTLAATLHLVTVVNVQAEGGVFDAGGLSEAEVERVEAEGRAALEELAERLDTGGIDLRQSLLNGEVHTEIDAYAADEDVDLLVMASEGETNIVGQRIGSVTRRVLQTVDRPIMVVPIPD